MSTGWFAVKKAFYHTTFDLVVLTGTIIQHPVRAGMWIDFPGDVGGPGRVPIASVEWVELRTGRELAVTVQFKEIAGSAFTPGVLEGHELEVRG